MIKNLTIFLDKEIKKLSPRSAKIIKKRFLSPENTLESIGRELSITRERVRQIQDKALEEIKISFKKNKIEEKEDFKEVIDFIRNIGGVRKEELFLADINKGWKLDNDFKYKFRLISFLIGKPKYFRENKDFYSFYYLKEKDKAKSIKTINNFLLFCNKNKEKVILSNLHLLKIKSLQEVNYLSISKKIGFNAFGDIGPSSWSEINPKNTAEKAYLILKKKKKPFHFRDIVKLINYYFRDKTVLSPSVHNELIKDARFVLVGRGIYALNEQGFREETARETIKRILKEKGPLTSDELVSFVEKEKFFKRRTILFNLQNRKYFKRLNDGRYILSKEI